MRKVGKAAFLFVAAAAFGEEASSDSARSETCGEMMARVKKSDCARPVARYLDGATVKLGFALHTSRMDLKLRDTAVAHLTGLLTPAPYYAFSLPKRFFGSSRLGWEV